MTTTTAERPVNPAPTHEEDGQVVYSAEPLVDLFLETEAAAEALGISERTVYRMLLSGLSWEVADEYACRIGIHPSALWPSWFTDAAADDDGEPIFQQLRFELMAQEVLR